ncbi:MAG: hypothetical protein ACM3YN_02035 [Parcubacteria group bacterium]
MPQPLWYGSALVLSAVLSALFGEARERKAVLVFAGLGAAWVVASTDPRPHAAAWILMILDAGAVVWLGKNAWKAERPWPIWALAAEAVAAAVSITYLLQPDVGAEVWLRGLLICRYAAVLALGVGACGRPAPHS